jgi:hypothetical protein
MGRGTARQPSKLREPATDRFAFVFGSARRGSGGVPDRRFDRPGPEAWWLRPRDWTVAGRLANAAARAASEPHEYATHVALMLDACACRGFGLIELRREEDGGYHVHSSNPRTGQTPATMSGFNPLPPTYFASNWGIDDELAFVLVEAWPEELVEALELDEAGDLRQFRGRLQVEGLEYGSGPRRLA